MTAIALSSDELNSLRVLATPESYDPVPRVHLERLSRLDLIEPGVSGVCVSPKGRQILVKAK